jgi:hypothetical protein
VPARASDAGYAGHMYISGDRERLLQDGLVSVGARDRADEGCRLENQPGPPERDSLAAIGFNEESLREPFSESDVSVLPSLDEKAVDRRLAGVIDRSLATGRFGASPLMNGAQLFELVFSLGVRLEPPMLDHSSTHPSSSSLPCTTPSPPVRRA